MKNRIKKISSVIIIIVLFCASIYLPKYKLNKERNAVYNVSHSVESEDIQLFETQYRSIKNYLLDAVYIADALETGNEMWQNKYSLDDEMVQKWISNLTNVVGKIDDQIAYKLERAEYVLEFYSERKGVHVAKVFLDDLEEGFTSSIVFEPNTGIPLVYVFNTLSQDYEKIFSDTKKMYEESMGIDFVDDLNWNNEMLGTTDTDVCGEVCTDGFWNPRFKRAISTDGVFEYKINMYNTMSNGISAVIFLNENYK